MNAPFPAASPADDAIWWRQLVEQSRDGIVVIDRTGRVCWVNDKFAAMLGYTRDEASRLTVWDWDAEIPPDALDAMLEDVDRSGDHFETVHTRRDGTTYDVEICTNAVRWGDRKLILCICRDVTERKRAARALQRALDESRSLTDQLTRHKDMLVQSEKLASLGQLAAGIAHEINNPLAYVGSNCGSLAGYIEGLAGVVAAAQRLVDGQGAAAADREAAVAELREAVEAADAEAVIADLRELAVENADGIERMRKIVENLRGFARADDARPRTASVADMIDSALLVTRNELKYRCEVTVDLADDLPELTCYPQQVEQVLMNLLVNAAQAITDHGCIRISAERDAAAVRIVVGDDGQGIPPELIGRIFDPFFTTKEIGKGTGLGLHIVRTIVERHGGEVAVASGVGAGTTFTVTLPLEVAAAAVPQTVG